MVTRADRATFRSMDQSTKQDWEVIGGRSMEVNAHLADRVLDHLRVLRGENGGFNVDRLEHSLQTATRAYRGGRDDEYVVCALLHDIGDTLAPLSHPDFAAAILKPFVSADNLWMVQHHGIFQGYFFFHHIGLDPDMREKFRGHRAFDRTAEFCAEYDAPAFDERYTSLPLEEFEPAVRALFATPRRSLYADPEQD